MNLNNKKQDRLVNTYKNRQDRFENLWKKQKQNLNRVSWLRLFAFIVFVVSVYSGIKSGAVFWYLVAFFLLITFLWMVKKSAKIIEKKDHFKALTDLNQAELLALEGDYSAFEDGKEFLKREHPFLWDLDLFGQQSVFQFINRSFTHRGKNDLASFLSDLLHDGESIRERQAAVQDLSERLEWRQHFQAMAMNLKQDPANEKSLLEWLGNPSPGMVPVTFRILAFTLPLISLTLFFLSLPGWISWQIPVYFMLLPLFLVASFLKRTQRFSLKMTSALKMLKNQCGLMRHIEKESLQAPLLLKIQENLFDQAGSASEKTLKLGKILDAFDSRNNIFVGVILNAFLLWDIHCLLRFEKWKRKNGVQAGIWLETLGYFDAISSLGTMLFNHPDYSFPVVNKKPSWEFVSVGHPLIPAETRVDNDLKIEKDGRILIVTGPNMAGKSTFLRALGVNLVFAMAGAPVCARQMGFFPNRLFTSMRTTDSLQKNESYFYSELKRLQVLF